MRSKILFSIMKKEVLQLRRDPRLIAFIINMPLLMILTFAFALKLEPDNVKMAYVDNDQSVFSNLIKTNIWNEGYFHLVKVANKDAIIEAIRNGDALAGLYIDKSFSSQLIENQQPVVQMYVDGTMPSLVTAMDNNAGVITSSSVTNDMYFLDEGDENTVIAPEPFTLDVDILFNPAKKETWFFLPGVIGILIMQVALILTGTSLVREKENNTLEQLIVSPISKLEFVLGKIFPYVVLCFIEFYFILVVCWYFFDVPLPSSQFALFMLAFIYVFGLIALGLMISVVSQTQQQAMFVSVFILIPSILLSGFIFPIESMPSWIRPVAYILPFTYFVDIIRGLLIKHTEIIYLLNSYLALFGFSLVFVVTSLIKFKKSLA